MFRFLTRVTRAASFATVVALAVPIFAADGESPCFEPVKTPIMRVDSPAQKLSVELNDARDLYLCATFGGDSYDCDQAIWAEPTLIDADGNRVDLTTLTPESAQTGWGTLLVGKNHIGKPLQIGDQTFKTGLWAHAPSLLHYRLDRPFVRFEASVGLDPNASRGSVEFQVLGYPVEYPKPREYKFFLNANAPKIPPVADAKTTFNPEAAQKLLDEGVDKLLFLRHYTYNGNHIYTDHVNCSWLPGAGFTLLDLKTGETRDVLYPELNGGMILSFDLSFDAKKIVFDYRKSPFEGYRIYESNIDGTGLRQITFPVEDEDALIEKYGNDSYHRGTDDFHPCYLPDGGIAFVSTRPQFSVLCDGGDNFTVTNLYRVEADGSGLKPLTFSALNELSPAVLPDGRIIYLRWEYVDKAAGNAKALWSINPDGTGPAEVYGDNITFPETMIFPRPVPGSDDKIVFLGTSHCCPNNSLGTIIEIDVNDDVRSPETMRYITDDVRTYHHNGFHFRDEATGEYKHDLTGKPGRLFKDPCPINDDLLIASRKPAGLDWADRTGYDLVLLDANGAETPLFSDESASCWRAYPVWERDVPPVRSTVVDEPLAAENRSLLATTDVYAGTNDSVERGSIKYLRVLEQIPRPWTARKTWGGDGEGTTHSHSAPGDGSLSIKVGLGIVPVEEDGSAQFYVPADRAVYFQALDENFRAIQTERTYVNYRPGEKRACVGCHETRNDAPTTLETGAVPIALTKEPSELAPQPGDETAEFVFDYDRQIQPIWNARCVACHRNPDAEAPADAPKVAAPDLSGTPEGVYSVSYWNLVKLSKTPKQLLGNRAERNEDAASNEIVYIPPYQTGTLSSPLGAWLFGDKSLKDAPESAREELNYLFDAHRDANVELTDVEKIRIATWLDANAAYHPGYWGRLNAKYAGRPDFRPALTPEEARSRVLPEKIRKLREEADAAQK